MVHVNCFVVSVSITATKKVPGALLALTCPDQQVQLSHYTTLVQWETRLLLLTADSVDRVCQV